MKRGGAMTAPASIGQLCMAFRRVTEMEDGVQLVYLLDPVRGGKAVLKEMKPGGRNPQDLAAQQGGEPYGQVLGLYLSSLQAKADSEGVRELELLCTCLKTWVQMYIEVDGSGAWMIAFMMFLSNLARRTAIQLDIAKRSEAAADTFLKKLVEIHRELFQKLNKERAKRAGHVWVCCELLRAYFKLGQISQCSFLLTAISQSLNKEGFRPTDLPKAISVTFYFYWGKHRVFMNQLEDADEKLTWAFDNCPAKAKYNRRKILLYLVPCKLRLGVLPSRELLQAYELNIFTQIVESIRCGDVATFTQKMDEHAADFIKMGTYLIMMRLKFTVLRSLVKGVHHELTKNNETEVTKFDIAPFEQAFAWQDGCDKDETSCLISTLVTQGAIKGYLSHEHKKIVFAKGGTAFPKPASWRK